MADTRIITINKKYSKQVMTEYKCSYCCCTIDQYDFDNSYIFGPITSKSQNNSGLLCGKCFSSIQCQRQNNCNKRETTKELVEIKKIKPEEIKINENADDNKRETITDGLYLFQKLHVERLIHCLTTNNVAFDLSEPGSGKTLTGIDICKKLELKAFAICPKSAMTNWKEQLDSNSVPHYGIINYQSIIKGKYYDLKKSLFEKTIKCPYIEVIKDKKTKKVIGFEWKLPKDTIIIFDEAHKCKNNESITSKLLRDAKHHNVKKLLLSGTLFDKPKFFNIYGYILNLYDTLRDGTEWIDKQGKDNKIIMQKINKLLFPKYASKMEIDPILIPKNEIFSQCYEMDIINKNLIISAHKAIQELKSELENGKEDSVGLGKITKARQEIEVAKIPTFVKLARKYLAEGKSVAFFVNYTDTLKHLAKLLNTDCLIHGGQTIDCRDNNIKKFQSNESKIIICNIIAGGSAISLHDLLGGHPRVSLISPTWSASDLIQVFFRTSRIGGKTETIQKIIFCEGTIEEKICENVRLKIENVAILNNDDLNYYKIQDVC